MLRNQFITNRGNSMNRLTMSALAAAVTAVLTANSAAQGPLDASHREATATTGTKSVVAPDIDVMKQVGLRDSQTYSGTSALSPAETVATPMTNNAEKNCDQLPVALRADAGCLTEVSVESSMTNGAEKNCDQLPVAMRADAGCDIKTEQ